LVLIWVPLTRKFIYKGSIVRSVADFGFLFSCVGVWQNDRVEIIANDQGNRTTPSYVAFSDNERLIGDAAKNQVAMNPHNTVFDAKRLIGRKFDDAEVQADIKHYPFKVFSKGGKPYISVEYRGETKEFVGLVTIEANDPVS
jgi:heat shock 70kDa protein 1/2/6/8